MTSQWHQSMYTPIAAITRLMISDQNTQYNMIVQYDITLIQQSISGKIISLILCVCFVFKSGHTLQMLISYNQLNFPSLGEVFINKENFVIL